MSIVDIPRQRRHRYQHRGAILRELGSGIFTKLYVDQKPVINRDRRQLTDWLARGIYPICLTCRIDEAGMLVKEGFNLMEVFDLSLVSRTG